MKKKLLAGFMTLCMLLSLLPSAAFAVETEAESSTEQTVPVSHSMYMHSSVSVFQEHPQHSRSME